MPPDTLMAPFSDDAISGDTNFQDFHVQIPAATGFLAITHTWELSRRSLKSF
jgi:hypothetical protein